ncbi:translation initiation factor eIF-2B subunit gamma, partial [Phenoliferia sp. Uapishka_3]
MFTAGASLHSQSLPKPQFRAVILCGYGSDLYPLVEPTTGQAENADDSNTDGGEAARLRARAPGQVKALLPVAGKRMIDWVLESVEEAGVYDILVLSPDSLSGPLAHHLRARRASMSAGMSSNPSSAKVELEEVPEGVARGGTVEIVRWAAEQDLIKTDFIILPCDLLMSPNGTNPVISLASLLDRHRADDNLLTMLFYERAAGGVVEARKDGPSEILTVFDSKTSTLLDIREMDEFDAEEVPLRTSLLARFPSPTLSTSLLPSQIYILSSALLPLLSSPAHDRRLRHMENIREFAAWISRLAWRNGGRDAVGYRDPRMTKREDGIALGRSTTLLPVGAASGGRSPAESMPQTGANTPAINGHGRFATNPWEEAESQNTARARVPGGGCKVVVWRSKDGWCGRGNTVAGWVEMNRAALKLLPPAVAATNTPPGVFISPDSFLHPSVYGNLGEKVGLKRCIIGKGSIVGKNSKLTNVVVMENAVIGENTKLENCVLSNGAQVRDRAILKDCELGRDVIVDAETQLKGEQLVVEEE